MTGTLSIVGFGLSTIGPGTATGLTTGRTISTTGDVTYTSGSFDGTSNLTLSTTLSNTGVVSNTYGSSAMIPKITVDSKGRVTSLEEVAVGSSAIGAPLNVNKIIVGNASNLAVDVNMTGDVGIVSTGATTVNSVGGVLSTTITTVASLVNSATESNTSNTIVKRDGSGGFSAGAITATSANLTNLRVTGGTLSAGSVLVSDASGNATWQASSGITGVGTVTSVNPITVNASGSTFTSTVTNASTTPSIALTIPLASVTGTSAGLLSKSDYDIFNAKQSSISLRFRSGGDYNIGIGARNGYETLGQASTPTGANNIAIGNNAMGTYYINDLTGSHNIALGTDAGGRNTTGSDNIFLGSSAGMNNYNGSQNTFIGRLADVNSDRGYNNGYTNATAIGYEAKVSGSNKIQLGNGSVTNVSTWGTLTAGTVTYPNVHNSIANQVLTINAAGTASWAPNSSASLSGGVAGAIPYQSGVGVTGYTAAGTAGQILTSAGTGAPTWVTTVPVANGGTGATTLASNAVLLGNGTSAVQTVAPGTSGNILTSNGTTWTSVAASSSGVTTLGNISATSNVKGATISGTTLTLTAADGTNGGVVTTAAQTFAGTKSFADVNLSGAITGSSTASSTIAGFNAALSTVTSNITISSANAATYNGKVLVCSGSAFTVTFDSTVPVGFSCMILQSDNNDQNPPP